MNDQTVDVAIVGSGFAGIGAAIRLLRDGRDDFVVLEKSDSLGGTWRDNTYPGCACDVQSHLYSFSFAPNPDWSRRFAPQPEIRAYLESVADRFDVRKRIRFGVEVVRAEWHDRRWTLRTGDGGTVSARAVIWATGPLHEPFVPDIAGLDEFEGTVFHSSRWNHDHDLRGRRVAVIGTGASAVQFVPAIQPEVGHLTIFQRTAAWVLPKMDGPVPKRTRRLYRAFPLAMRLQRALIYARSETVVTGVLRPGRLGRTIERFGRAYLDRKLADRPDLKAKVTPDFTIGCKRILLSNTYYPALKQPNVEVVTEKVARVTPNAVVTAEGTEHEVDTIILGTGFRVGVGMGRVVPIIGRHGVALGEESPLTPEAFLGTTFAGFPNLFVLAGPNTGVGHTSLIYMIESQLNYVLGALRLLDERRVVALEPRRDRQDAYNARVQGKLSGTVWLTGGCASWYLDPDGRNRFLWPDYTFRFRRRTSTVRAGDHELLA